MKYERFQKVYLPLLGIALLVSHGLEDRLRFKVDWVSLSLLGLIALPFIIDALEYVKSGDIELRFRALKISEQTLMFLRGVAPKRQWTFYKTREQESHLGEAFRIVVQELVSYERATLVQTVRELLDSDNDNSQWLASEIIGYFQLQELRDSLPLKYASLSQQHGAWRELQLNCLWAHSRFDDYREVHRMLATTTSPANQSWLLFVYEQMILEGHAKPADFVPSLHDLLTRKDITAAVRQEAEQILLFLEGRVA